MFFELKKFLFNTSLNITFFLMLLIGIQNSSNKAKINFLINETIKLPISFIIGASFISGSMLGGFITLDFFKSSK
ncbi:hypothetical protein CU311_06575 [Prochlorococcus marinus str. MU1402]|nr:hypothetical protein [Prochlorococcus marinus]MBO8232344.1 hypothetical protein [Prochlorococcus marinus XMU1402]MBW3057072.1 hypothetical protein [Prochlorococcus marinus str. MU1402]